MTDVTKCPECGGETRLEYTENQWNSHVKHVRTCNECPTQFTVSYADPLISEVEKL